jgi:hypothetical protein
MLENYKTANTEQITGQYPVDAVLGAFKDFWTSDKLTGMEAVSFFRQSPARNSEAEVLLGRLVATAAREGQWVGYDTKWQLEELASFNEGRQSGKLSHFGRGLAAAIDTDLLGLEEADGKVYVVPKEGLARLTQERVQQYSSK